MAASSGAHHLNACHHQAGLGINHLNAGHHPAIDNHHMMNHIVQYPAMMYNPHQTPATHNHHPLQAIIQHVLNVQHAKLVMDNH